MFSLSKQVSASADPRELSHSTGLLLRQTLLRRRTAGRVQTLSPSSEQGEGEPAFLRGPGSGSGKWGPGNCSVLRAEPQSLCVDEDCGEAFHLHRRPQAFPTCSAEPGTICQVSRYCSLHLHEMSPPRLRGGRLFSPAHRPSAGASFSAPRGLQPMGLPRPSGGCSMPASC